MFFESAAFVVDALHQLGPNVGTGHIARACKMHRRTTLRHLEAADRFGLVTYARQAATGPRRWSLTARGEAVRQALMVPPCDLRQVVGVEVAILSESLEASRFCPPIEELRCTA